MADEGQQRCHSAVNTGRQPFDKFSQGWDAVSRPPTQCTVSQHRPSAQPDPFRNLAEEWEWIASHIEALRYLEGEKELQPATLVYNADQRNSFRSIATTWEKTNSRILNLVSTTADKPATPIVNLGNTVIAYCRFKNNQGIFWFHLYDIEGNEIARESVGELGLEDSIGNELAAAVATMGIGIVAGMVRGIVVSGVSRAVLTILVQGVSKLSVRAITWVTGRLALRRLGQSMLNLLNHEVLRSARVLTKPEVFRHVLTADNPMASYALIEKGGELTLATGAKAHYGDGLYVFASGSKQVRLFIDIEVAAGTAAENLVVKNVLNGKIEQFVRLVPATGKTLPVKIVGHNLSPVQIAMGRTMAFPKP
jgi:hypothetical protein